jgi:hypothetical protein
VSTTEGSVASAFGINDAAKIRDTATAMRDFNNLGVLFMEFSSSFLKI